MACAIKDTWSCEVLLSFPNMATDRIVRICVCKYTCIHACMHAYVRTYVHTYIHKYIHTYTRTHVHTYTPTHVRTYTHTHTYTRTHIHTHRHTYVRTYIHTHRHTYVRTYVRSINLRVPLWASTCMYMYAYGVCECAGSMMSMNCIPHIRAHTRANAHLPAL